MQLLYTLLLLLLCTVAYPFSELLHARDKEYVVSLLFSALTVKQHTLIIYFHAL